MRVQDDPFEIIATEEESDGFSALRRRPVSTPPDVTSAAAVIARLHSFDLCEQPLLADVPGLVGEVVPARSTVELSREQIGANLLVLFEQGDVRRPIVIGVLNPRPSEPQMARHERVVSVQADDGRVVLSAEREIVLRCGEASITLTSAGKVLIQGAYVSTRSAGVNRIKGGSVQIN